MSLKPNDGVEILFETAHPAVDPEGLITKFLQYESFRLTRETYQQDMIGTLQQRLSVLIWYLDDYVRHRNYAHVVPLAASQIAFLNRPAPLAGASSAVTIALLNFVARDMPDYLKLNDPDVLKEAVYWWCVEKTPRLKFEGPLVTDDQVALLQKEDLFIGEDYALTTFMRLFFKRNAALHKLDMTFPRDRAALFYYLVLHAFTHPWIVRLLPREPLRRSLRDLGSGGSALDRVLARYAFGAGKGSLDEARALRRIGATVLEKAGYRLEIDRTRNASALKAGAVPAGVANVGECLLNKTTFKTPVEPGIAVIGPILKTSGLGQAARLSLAILNGIETPKPTALLFDLDNPAPVGFASQTTLLPYKNRRAINLIHLNAESIPLAFAFEQRDILQESYNIGFFFWELNMIPKCHALALELLDEIWVSSEYNREIYARFTDKPVINVGMAVEPLPAVTPMDRADLDLEDDAFVFLTTFDSFSFIERKNPIGVLDSFRAAFPTGSENVRLILKTQNRTRVYDPYQMRLWTRIDAFVRADPRIIIVNETYQYRDVLALKLACDCYVSLHRSEGWGFGMIEAMQLGKPVIATAYSGNMDFCTEATAYLVDYDLIPVRDDEYIFVERGSQWAAPRVESASARMREVAADRVACSAKGAAAAVHIKASFGIAPIGKRFAARLAELRASR